LVVAVEHCLSVRSQPIKAATFGSVKSVKETLSGEVACCWSMNRRNSVNASR
jgi:hypothetical protein